MRVTSQGSENTYAAWGGRVELDGGGGRAVEKGSEAEVVVPVGANGGGLSLAGFAACR